MHKLAELLTNSISSGLSRKAITSCSKWAEKYRVMGQPRPGPWSFTWHPWLREMHDSKAEVNIGQKGAQLGFTEWALNMTFYAIDILRLDCLYVLPAQTPDAHDFSSARFGPALEMSPYLGNLFTDVNNIGHKRAGTCNLYVRGARSESGLKSIPTGMVVLDELDEMEKRSIQLAMERAAGQQLRRILMISTPTFPKKGINEQYLDSTMERFFFPCPCCSRATELVFPQCLEVTGEDITDPNIENSHLKCKECGGKLNHWTKTDWLSNGYWIKSFEQRSVRGFHVNQLYSTSRVTTPVEIAKAYLKSLRDPAEEQDFYNSKIGVPHLIEGAGITDANIDECISDYRRVTTRPNNALITIGIDVGRWFHYEIDQWILPAGHVPIEDIHISSFCKMISFGKVREPEELDDLMRRFGINFGIIDSQPENRISFQFCSRFHGFVKMCYYSPGINGKQIHVNPENEYSISVNRTSWLDLSLGRFRNPKMFSLPRDVDFEYRENIKAPIRIYEKDRFGNNYAVYREGNDADHYAHARNYSEIALHFAVGVLNPQDIYE